MIDTTNRTLEQKRNNLISIGWISETFKLLAMSLAVLIEYFNAI